MMIHSGAARSLSMILAALTLSTGFGQTPQEPSKGATAVASPLRIAVLEGDRAVNSIPLKQSVTPIIEVRDENEFPVEGATVVFTLPGSGPGGFFPGNQTTFTARSDLQGQATAPFAVNGLPGKFLIKVTATLGNRTGAATIVQTNTSGAYIGPAIAPRPWYKKWPIWAIAGGAAAAGAVVLIRRGGDSSSSTIIFTPGGPVFGGPR